jgi:transposase-like protein
VGRATYAPEDKARVYVVLTANDGNVKRTARETGLPESTVSRWKREFEKNPPSTELVETAANDFVGEADDLRMLGLKALRGKLEQLIQSPKDVNVGQVTTMIGILTDKIDRAQGLNTKVEHEHRLNSSDIRDALVGFVTDMQQLARSREEEIQDAEIIEQPALPAGS